VVLLGYGVVLVASGGKKPTAFNESRHIGLVIYQNVLTFMLFGPLLLLVDLSRTEIWAIVCFAVLLLSFGSVVILYGPKIVGLLTKTETDPLCTWSSGTKNRGKTTKTKPTPYFNKSPISSAKPLKPARATISSAIL